MNRGEQTIALNNTVDHVSEQFGLNGDYRVTNFKAKDYAVTLESANYEITIKCKDMARDEIYQKCMEDYRALREEKEKAEELDMQYDMEN